MGVVLLRTTRDYRKPEILGLLSSGQEDRSELEPRAGASRRVHGEGIRVSSGTLLAATRRSFVIACLPFGARFIVEASTPVVGTTRAPSGMATRSMN